MVRDFDPVTLKPVSSATGGDNDDHTIIYGYMCTTDWECEMGLASGGNVIYPSLEDIKSHRTCLSQCGIIKVAVVAVEIVQEGNWDLEEEDNGPSEE